MGWQERGAFEVVPLPRPRRGAAGGAALISPPLALSAQVEELDPAGGGRRTGGKEGEKYRGREWEGKSTPPPQYYSPFPLLSLSLFLSEPN